MFYVQYLCFHFFSFHGFVWPLSDNTLLTTKSYLDFLLCHLVLFLKCFYCLADHITTSVMELPNPGDLSHSF